ncbi:MAG: hypothetical protein JJU13_11890 [Balneolaceae bacterium]|nr:hypothetical protein [Balneolaceae bacterium]
MTIHRGCPARDGYAKSLLRTQLGALAPSLMSSQKQPGQWHSHPCGAAWDRLARYQLMVFTLKPIPQLDPQSPQSTP